MKNFPKTILIEYFKSRPEVEVCYLFGSQVSGRTNRLSDIDIAVLIAETQTDTSFPYGYRAHLISDLMKLLKTNRIDVALLNKAPYFLKHRVIAFGKCLYARNEADRVRFEADTMGRYPDVKRLVMAGQ